MENTRFADLRKIPKQPALRLVAMGNSKLKSKLSSPANASVTTVLEELESKAPDMEASLDMLRLMAMALPARERVWWACLAGRDVIGPNPEKVPRTLDLAEKWVRKPSDELREAAREAAEIADVDDETVLCATSVMYYDEKLGIGELAQYAAPPGASQNIALAMVVQAVPLVADNIVDACNILVDRAVDIARGGNGQTKVEQDITKQKEA